MATRQNSAVASDGNPLTMDHPLVRAALARGEWSKALYRLHNQHRPDLIEHMVAIGMSGTAELAEVLAQCWRHDHHYLRAKLGSRRLIKLFKDNCNSPFDFPERIYRGDSLSWRWPAPHSWTLDPDLAAWFAVLYRGGRRDPAVITGIVNPGDVLLFTDDRNEAEVVASRVHERRIWSDDPNKLMQHALIWQCTGKTNPPAGLATLTLPTEVARAPK
jgi:hypothetical protein